MNFQDPQPLPTIDLTGRELGDYRIIRRLGRGGMADVYLASQNSLNRNVALKVLKPDLAKDESYVERFRREAKAAAGLHQANIVQIHEVGEKEGFYFICQEYVQGRNLKQYLSRHGAVEPVMAINVLRQCALALQESGKQNVIHRDIKPENIMLSTNGEVKITDFGLARINNDASQQALTQVGVTMGTPLYMSPEQVEGASIDLRSDIYSLGVTAYHMLAGHPPFDGDNALSIALKHVKDDAVPLTTLRPDVPVELCKIIEQMMSKKRGDRPNDAKHLLKELRKVKIDFDDDWEMIVEKLSASEASSSAASGAWSRSNLAATRQLQSVMKGNIRSWWKSATAWRTLTLLGILGLVCGVLYATQSPPRSILDIGDAPAVTRLASAEKQFEHARLELIKIEGNYEYQLEKMIELWNPESVSKDEFHSNRFYYRRAKSDLAVIQLNKGRYVEANKTFKEFIGYEDVDEEFKVAGYAGSAITYSRMNASSFAGGAQEKQKQIRDMVEKAGPKLDKLDLYHREIKRQFLRLLDELNSESSSRSNNAFESGPATTE